MNFTDNNPLQEFERMMRRIPNFAPRGHGVVVICSAESIESGMATHREVMTRTMSAITNKPFLIRLEKYIEESERNPMEFKSVKHKQVFEETTEKFDKKNYGVMAAVYLLTADSRLWNMVKRYVVKNDILFHDVHLKGCTENGYTLYCAAKDLYLGTKYLSIFDLADTELVPPKVFALICNAMAIRRFGLGAINFNTDRETKK